MQNPRQSNVTFGIHPNHHVKVEKPERFKLIDQSDPRLTMDNTTDQDLMTSYIFEPGIEVLNKALDDSQAIENLSTANTILMNDAFKNRKKLS